MKKILNLMLALTVVMFVLPSCGEKEGCTDVLSIMYDSEAEKDDGSCVYGGTGGNVILKAYPQHHGNPIVGDSSWPDSAFVKFNAINSPGLNPKNYDAIFVGEDGEDHVHITGLKPGKYFIMMAGWDSTERVTGGIPVVFSQTSGEIPIAIPVTE